MQSDPRPPTPCAMQRVLIQSAQHRKSQTASQSLLVSLKGGALNIHGGGAEIGGKRESLCKPFCLSALPTPPTPVRLGTGGGNGRFHF